MIKFHLSKECEAFRPELVYVLKLWAKNQRVNFVLADDRTDSISIGAGSDDLIRTGRSWTFSKEAFNDQRMMPGVNGESDLLATAFYMINALQEYNDTDPDALGRFRYRNSYQFKYSNVRSNIVQDCFDEITRQVGLSPRREVTRFFLTHDIDLVNSAVIEDGFNVLKRGRIDLFFAMLFNFAIGKPEWLNMDKIMKIESLYDCKSVFFWIVNRGKINKRERNADYTFSSRPIQDQFCLVEQNGFENGLHKSISNERFETEFAKFGCVPFSNRYHYLKFSLPRAYHDIEVSGLKLDASLGFAEEIGFRNSYGLPFNPYDMPSRKPFSFVEVPLHVMDRTFFQYKRSTVAEAEKDILDFFELNKYNCVLSILWHNNFFTSHKFNGYLDLYKRILTYIRDNNFKTISQKEIVDNYAIA